MKAERAGDVTQVRQLRRLDPSVGPGRGAAHDHGPICSFESCRRWVDGGEAPTHDVGAASWFPTEFRRGVDEEAWLGELSRCCLGRGQTTRSTQPNATARPSYDEPRATDAERPAAADLGYRRTSRPRGDAQPFGAAGAAVPSIGRSARLRRELSIVRLVSGLPTKLAGCHACDLRPGQIIDHDHLSGLVRGLVCRHCNTALGKCVHIGAVRGAQPPASMALGYLLPPHTRRPAQGTATHRTVRPEPIRLTTTGREVTPVMDRDSPCRIHRAALARMSRGDRYSAALATQL
ncbi:endonuclease domain-containing protein [Kribbella sp. NPDC023972]|uniref:endonuclease domain-containing protein n=1 Tax=Kribbella sp. NPDC023972 TaxID=3154795 RepID=UPI0033C4ABF2